MLLDGLYLPLATPFYPDGRVYLRKLEHNAARYSLTHASGLIVLGPSSEAEGLTDAEAVDVMQAAAGATQPQKVLIAGITRDSVHATLLRAQQAAAAGFDAVLLGVPQSWARLAGSTSTGSAGDPWQSPALLTFFRAVADRSPLPVLLWSGNELPSPEIPVAVVAELARHPNIQGMLDAGLASSASSRQPGQAAKTKPSVFLTELSSGASAQNGRDLLAPESASHAVEARLQALLSATRGIERMHEVTPTFQAVTARMHAAHAALQVQRVPTSMFVPASALLGGAGAAISADPVSAGRSKAASMQGSVGSSVIMEEPMGGSTSAPVEVAGNAAGQPLKTRSRTTGFQIVACGVVDVYAALRDGAHAVAPELATAVPQACHEVVAAWKDGDPELAREKQQRITTVQAVVAELGVPGVKYASELSGYYGGPPRLPLLPITAEQRRELADLLHSLRS
jgi:4-hydroxy-2-oxoglutarate aldolase